MACHAVEIEPISRHRTCSLPINEAKCRKNEDAAKYHPWGTKVLWLQKHHTNPKVQIYEICSPQNNAGMNRDGLHTIGGRRIPEKSVDFNQIGFVNPIKDGVSFLPWVTPKATKSCYAVFILESTGSQTDAPRLPTLGRQFFKITWACWEGVWLLLRSHFCAAAIAPTGSKFNMNIPWVNQNKDHFRFFRN
ncbi:hypothetical protein Fcan01_18644 [Folsomia candida]|uniref:Uncharacterized protein n=1 Tax=Folsomia candida TaxID=158441 RepID=A0A226DN52_FOLCA|nr:hypothetical protein Fcan01_18644 [Folsomia candida]